MNAIKKSRALSFAVIGVIYVLTSAVGITVYRQLPLAWWLSLLLADVIATAFIFLFSLLFKNASVYDPYWSVQPPVILGALVLGHRLTVLGILLIIAVSFWAVRLTANWAYTFGGLEYQDWRYTMLCERTGSLYILVNFVGIHLVPTLVVCACTLPAVYAVLFGVGASPYSYAFIALSLAAATLQGIADIEMHKFRKSRVGGFIRVGLWKYSRHPNYLGEILMWWGVALAVVAAEPSAWYLIAGAVSNTALFVFVSIPLAEGKQSKKAGYEEYRKATRALLPIIKKI